MDDGRMSARGSAQAGIVASSVYMAGRRVADIPIEEAGAWAGKEGHVVWIGLLEPSRDLLLRVQAQFNLHDLAIEDAEHPHQRPKLEQYGDGVFIVARTAHMLDGRISFGETHIFVGRGYIVSVRHGASTSYAPVRQRAESCPTVLSHGEDYILYALLDFIVDNYMPVLETMNTEVEAIEDQVFAGDLTQVQVQRLYTLRRDLLRLRNAASALVDVCRRVQRVEVRPIEASMQPLFRDVTDHIHRVQDEIDALREVLAFAFEASMMAGQVQQTHISRRLAAWAAILAVPTAVAGIYGMNFEVMPELKWQYGYLVVLGAVATICGTLYYRLRKSGWL
jgi:magnesium transporter